METNGFFRFSTWLLSIGLLVLPLRSAQAGLTVAGSAGLGVEVTPSRQVQAVNLMVAPGLAFLEVFRAELGIVGAYAHAREGQLSDTALEFRPMLVIAPPILPLYVRVVAGAINLFSSTRTLAYGGALGASVSLFDLSLFAEAGVLPRSLNSVFYWVVEGRLGLMYTF